MTIHPTRPHRRASSVTFLGAALPALLWALGGCGEGYVGDGLGRPDFAARSTAKPQGAIFSRLVAPTAAGADAAFVELLNRSGHDIDTAATPMFVQTRAGTAPLPATTWRQGTALQIAGAAVAALDVHATVGDMLLLGENLVVEAYAAWGTDPNALPGSMAYLARSLGLSTDWAPLPYPVAASVAINLDPERRRDACVVGTPGAAQPFAAVDCLAGQAPAQLWLSRIIPAGVDPAGSAVELLNPTAQALDLTGVQLCLRGACAPIMPLAQNDNDTAGPWMPPTAANLAQGAPEPARRRLVLAFGQALAQSDIITALPSVSSHDEVALLPPGAALADAAGPWSYVRLSTDPQNLPAPTALAQKMAPAVAAAWGNVTLPAPRLPGESLVLARNESNAPLNPGAWGLSNLPMGTHVQTLAGLVACSSPARPGPKAPLSISQISLTRAGALIILDNLTASPIDLTPWQLAQGPAKIALRNATDGANRPSPVLAPKGALWVALAGPSGVCQDPYDLCWNDSAVSLGQGELTLLNQGVPAAHLQWGAMARESQLGDDAVAAGVWPHPSCRVANFSGTASDTTLVRLPAAAGLAPPDFAPGAAAQGLQVDVAEP